jgi:antitoxin component YwqK of YwqJK toxin-antitoxin module
MSEKPVKKFYKSKKIELETYTQDGAFITKHYYDDKNNHVRERILVRGDTKEINSFTKEGVFAKSENFLNGLRDGVEIKYIVAKANKSIKSTKHYAKGKLHGESITYNMSGDIIKQELFALGKPVCKYLRDEAFDVIGIEMIDKDAMESLPAVDIEKLRGFMSDHPEWFTK